MWRLSRFERARARKEPTSSLETDLDARLLALRTYRASQRARLPWRRESPELDLAALQERLTADTTLVAYWLGEEAAAAWVVTRRAVTLVELGPTPAIRTAVTSAYAALAEQGGQPPDLGPLATLILRPIEDSLVGRRLAVVVDGTLEPVAFAALPSRAGQPLVASRDVVRLPAAMWLLQDSSRPRPASGARRVAVVADPVFAIDDQRVVPRGTGSAAPAASTRSDEIPARLPFSRREADVVAALAAGTVVLADFDASKARVSELPLDRVDVLHLATHAEQHAARPDLSSVVLSLVDARGQRVDGKLRLHEIVGLPLDGQLVVLSACRTIIGPDLRGEGLQGLARAFLQAGAASVVASLWDVDDRATMTLMGHFYAGLVRDGLTPAGALSAAQRAMREDPRWRHPRDWAGFTVLGSIE